MDDCLGYLEEGFMFSPVPTGQPAPQLIQKITQDENLSTPQRGNYNPFTTGIINNNEILRVKKDRSNDMVDYLFNS